MSFVQFIDCHPGHTCGSLHEVEDVSKDESLRPGPAMGAAGGMICRWPKGFSINGGYPNSWLIYNGKTLLKWMI